MTNSPKDDGAIDKVPHHWQPSKLGHGEWICFYCLATNREIDVIGDPNHCAARVAINREKNDE